MHNMNVLLTVSQLAKRWEFHPESIRRAIRRGDFPVLVIGGRLRIPLEVIEKYERERWLGNLRSNVG